MKWCHALVPIVGDILGVEPLLTIGAHFKNGRPVFNPGVADIERWAHSGLSVEDLDQRSGLNLHAWLTLPTGEVMDPTLPSTIAVVCKQPQWAGQIIGGWPADDEPMTNVPLAVGQAYAEAVRRRTPFPLLAQALTPEAMAPSGLSVGDGVNDG